LLTVLPAAGRAVLGAFGCQANFFTQLTTKATLIKVPISGTTSDFDPLIAQCEISALRLA
jgi:hypothetical protein